MDRHCCEDMRREAERACGEHPDRHECPDCLVHYSPAASAYGLIVHDGGHSIVRIHYCPWCGSRLARTGGVRVAAEGEKESSAQRDWAVWRIDDNANTFLVRGGLSRDEAERVAAEFAARGHKQTYWVERDAAEPAPAPDTGRPSG